MLIIYAQNRFVELLGLYVMCVEVIITKHIEPFLSTIISKSSDKINVIFLFVLSGSDADLINLDTSY